MAVKQDWGGAATGQFINGIGSAAGSILGGLADIFAARNNGSYVNSNLQGTVMGAVGSNSNTMVLLVGAAALIGILYVLK